MRVLEYIPKIGERVEFASRFIGNNDKILDVGCGDGILMYFIRNNSKKVYGIDNSGKELQNARKRGMIVKKVDLDREKIPFIASSFDCMVCLDVIEHVKDPEKLLREINRVSKVGGKLILATPNVRFTNHLFDLVIMGRFPKTSTDPSLYDGGHLHFFTYGDIIELLKKTGFRIAKIEGIINKPRRGWKGRILEMILGKKFMLEFRAPGILIVATKITK